MSQEKFLILASGSPRRKELLAQLGHTFSVLVPAIEEVKRSDESPADYVKRLATEKAQAGLMLAQQKAEYAQDADLVVLGSDTVVVCDEQVLEKPHDLDDAKRMLLSLAGRQHQVMTAVSVVNKQKQSSVIVTTDVWFKPLSEEEIEQYWQSGEPCDKAGSYGIQGLGGRFVTRIEGSYHAVVGLPLFETDQLLHEFI